jgi:hypothetical protein
MPLVNHQNPTDLDRIHIQRMGHAHFALFLELLAIDSPEVDRVLGEWNITLLPYRRVGIEYPSYAKQILENELIAEKNRLAAEANKPVKPAPKAKKRK